MKILHYADCADLSFLVPWLDLMGEIGARGIEQTILCRPGGDVARVAGERGVPVHTWKPTIASVPKLNPQYPSIVKRFAPDLIHTRLSAASGIAAGWRRAVDIPVVATFDKPAKAKYYRGLDRYIACAEWLKRYMVSEQGLDAEKIDVVYNSVDLEKYAFNEAERKKFRAAHGIGEDERVFAGLGIYIPRKGFDTLIRAFADTAARHGDVRLMLIGDGEERARYLRLIDELGIAGRVILPDGFVRDVRPWLWGADYFVMSSREEGFSIALLEVMAAGLPVIVSNIPPCTEIIRDGENGFVAEVDDPASFADRMNRMHELSESERRQLAGRTLDLMQNFTNEIVASRTIEVYERVLAEHGKR